MRHDLGGIPTERDALKAEIKAELRRDAIRGRIAAFGSCSLLMLVALSIPAYLVASSVAKTGLVRVPVISGGNHSPVEPSREIVPLVGSGPEDVIASVMAGADYDPATGRITLTLSEQQITTLVASSVSGQKLGEGPDAVTLTSAQIAVESDEMELHVTAKKGDRSTSAALLFEPMIEHGKFDMKAKRLVIGELEVPEFVAEALLSTIASPLRTAIDDAFGGVSGIREFRMEQGVIHITIDKP